MSARKAWAERFTIKAQSYGSHRWSAYDAATGGGPLHFPYIFRGVVTTKAFFRRKRDVLAAIEEAWDNLEYFRALEAWEGEGGAVTTPRNFQAGENRY